MEQLKAELAAAHRICAAHGFNEGVCNHLTVEVSDTRASRGSASLVIAHGWDWAECTADRLILFDNHTGEVLEGSGDLEITAFQIHSALHTDVAHNGQTSRKVVFHTRKLRGRLERCPGAPHCCCPALTSGSGARPCIRACFRSPMQICHTPPH